MARGKMAVEKSKQRHRLVRYKEGCEIYSMGMTKFQQLAKEARAVIKYDGVVWVDTDSIDKFLEGFRVY